jgi:formylmethanofuran dehydrogenase subunit E
MCPGLAMGVRAAELALERIGPHSTDEEVVAIVETDTCGVDAVQYLTGCTFGKGNLIHRDYGKNAYTFIRRSDAKAVRISTKPDAWGPRDPESEALFARVRAGTAGAEERERFNAGHARRAHAILNAPIEQLYDVREVDVPVPQRARVHASVLCESCGESTMETRVRRFNGRELCQPCFDAAVEGRPETARATAAAVR